MLSNMQHSKCCTVLILKSCVGSLGVIYDARPVSIQFPGHRSIDDLTTERSFDLLATRVIDVLGLFFDVMLHTGVCTTKHLQTPGRPMQALNVFTVQHGKFSGSMAIWTYKTVYMLL